MNSDLQLNGHGGKIFAVARDLGADPGSILDFSASINLLGVAPAVRDALVQAFDRIGNYPDSSSYELRQAIARQIGLPGEQVIVSNGSTELIHLVPRLFPGANRRALLVAPTF